MIANEKRNLIISYFSEKKQVLTVSQMKDKINESSKYKFFRFDSDSDSDCGDTIFLLVKQEDNIIKKIFFSDQSSCLISTSATSMLCS
jgi:NifU-like protein involved in Fe-S cluster formation